MKVALLGTGLMGAPMARNLAAAGHELDIWNRSYDKALRLADCATVHRHPRDAVAAAEVVIAMLFDGPVTSSVLVDQGVLEAAPRDALFIDMGSVEPDRDRELARAANALGKRYLDAPVSGGVKGAEAGDLSIFVGGSAADLEYARPVLEVLGRPTLIGPLGAGQSAKLANQLIVAITIGAVAEAFKMAESAGCDPATLRQALRGGFADSRILEQHGLRMVERDFEPGGRSRSQLKDIHNALAVAAEHGLELPLADTVERSFRSLVDDYDGGDLDHSAYYLWLEKKLPGA
jgi:2-hydroxy-3-oxopropionate reductase